jgi:hypothetical protein
LSCSNEARVYKFNLIQEDGCFEIFIQLREHYLPGITWNVSSVWGLLIILFLTPKGSRALLRACPPLLCYRIYHFSALPDIQILHYELHVLHEASLRVCNSCSTTIPDMSGVGDLPSLLLSAADTSDALLFPPFIFHQASPCNSSCSISSRVGLRPSSMVCTKNIFLYLWLVRIIHPTPDIHMDACGLIQRQQNRQLTVRSH